MIKILFYPAAAPEGPPIEVAAQRGQSVMQAAVAEGLAGIEADCGGMLTCATCHVYVREPFASRLPAAAQEELAMLEFTAAERRPTSRLSCQLMVDEGFEGLALDLPPIQH